MKENGNVPLSREAATKRLWKQRFNHIPSHVLVFCLGIFVGVGPSYLIMDPVGNRHLQILVDQVGNRSLHECERNLRILVDQVGNRSLRECENQQQVAPLQVQQLERSSKKGFHAEDALLPLERSNESVTLQYRSHQSDPDKRLTVDTFTPFHKYMSVLGLKAKRKQVKFPELPQLHTWHLFFEAYHNHMARFRGLERVVFMEVGVQSGGKIALMRKYFGPGFEYIGLDINPSTKMFESADWVHIEIGDSGDPQFLQQIKKKYPHVDIFLDDGGHTMQQQMTAFQEMLPHVQPDGVFICEDLATSWNPNFGGIRNGHVGTPGFLEQTMVGLIHRTMDWFMAGTMWTGAEDVALPVDQLPLELFPDNTWWKMVPLQVKHIHYYNQIVVYEKGVVSPNSRLKTVGAHIPVRPSGKHQPVDWNLILQKLDHYLDPK